MFRTLKAVPNMYDICTVNEHTHDMFAISTVTLILIWFGKNGRNGR